MPRYRVCVTWQVYGYVEVEADSEDDAVGEAYAAPVPEVCGRIDFSRECFADDVEEITEEEEN